MPFHVVLLTRDTSLAVAVRALLDEPDRVTELDSQQDWPPPVGPSVDAVVVDLPAPARPAAVEEVRRSFDGPLVVLLEHGEDPSKTGNDQPCAVLSRPFGMSQLWSLLGASTPAATAAGKVEGEGGGDSGGGAGSAEARGGADGRDVGGAGGGGAEARGGAGSGGGGRAGGAGDNPAWPGRSASLPPLAQPLPQAKPAAQPEPSWRWRLRRFQGPRKAPAAAEAATAEATERMPAVDTSGNGAAQPPAKVEDAEAAGAAAEAAGPAEVAEPAEVTEVAEPGTRTEVMPAIDLERLTAGAEIEVDRAAAPAPPSARGPAAPAPSATPATPTAPAPAPAPAVPTHPPLGAGHAVTAAGPVAARPIAPEAGVPTEAPEEEVAARLAHRLHADAVALLLDNSRGLLEVAGGVGLTAAERALQVEYGHHVLRELFRVGVGLIEDTGGVRGILAGIPGGRADTLMLVPLLHEGHGFGVVIAGRRRGRPRDELPQFSEAEIESLMDFAEDIAPALRSAVLLRHLKARLDAPSEPQQP